MSKIIRCPYHLGLVEVSGIRSSIHCPECGTLIPRDFIEKTHIPRVTVGLIGFSGHGKTVYITSLFYLLKFLQAQWPSYYLRTLDDHTYKIFFENIPTFERSELPESTPVNFPLPALIFLGNLPHFGDWFFSFFDTAGEVFEAATTITNEGRFVAHAEVILFLISIPDSGEDWPDRIQALVDIYIRAVYGQLGLDLKKRQHLIVVFSKGDLLLDREAAVTGNFLMSGGSYQNYTHLEHKLSELSEISQNLRTWLEGSGGQGLVNLCQDNFKSVEYTIVSATGAAPVGNRLVTTLQPDDPKRVLDPFLWIMLKTKRPGFWKRIWSIITGT